MREGSRVGKGSKGEERGFKGGERGKGRGRVGERETEPLKANIYNEAFAAIVRVRCVRLGRER